MVLPTILKRRHSLKGVELLQTINKIKLGQPESLKEYARIQKDIKTEELTLEDIGVHVKELTGESLDVIMELADRNLSVQEGRYALHILILHANEFGQPKWQELSLAANPSQVPCTSAPVHVQTDSNSKKRKRSPDPDSLEDRIATLQKISKLEMVKELKEKRHQICVVTMETSVAVYESNFVGSVIPHFNGGVQSLQLILQILLNTKTSWNSLSKSEADKLMESISRPVQQAYDSFEKANIESAKHKSIIDRAFEKSISVERQLSNDARNSESKIQQQTTAIEVKSKQIQDAMNILQNTKAHLNSANGNVQAARDEYERRKRKKRKGFLGIRIPIIDDIVAELSGLNSAINRADDNVGHATEEVNRQAAVVQQREQELSTLQNELTKLKEENNVKEIEVKQQQEYISKLKKIEKEINTVRESLGKCTNYISTTFGKTKILRDEAKSLFSLEPLLNTIKDIEQQLKGSSGNIGVDGNTNLQLAKQRFFLLSEKAQNIRLLQNGHDRKIEEL